MMLTMKPIPHPSGLDASVQTFASARKAIEHILNHILTAPESDAWRRIAPELSEIVNLEDEDSRWRIANNIADGDRGAAQELYDIYVEQMVRSVRDANSLGWHVTVDGVTSVFGTNAVLVLIAEEPRQLAKTAFIPGMGDAEATRAASQKPPSRSTVLARESGGKRKRLARRGVRSLAQEAKRRQAWSAEKEIFYLVFRPAVRKIRSGRYDPGMVMGRNRHEYAELKHVLPTSSRLKLEDWTRLRHETRGETESAR